MKKTFLYIETAALFLACAALPVAFLPGVGADEKFYAVKAALLIILACIGAAARLLRLAADPAAPDSRERPFILFGPVLAWFGLTAILAANGAIAIRSLAYFAALFCMYHLAASFPDRRLLRASLAAGTLLGGAAAAVYGLLEFLGLAGQPLFIEWGDRAASFFSDPNFFGLYLLFPLLLAAGIALFSKYSKLIKIGAAALSALFLIALLLSNSRSAWLSLLCGLALFVAATAATAKGGAAARIKPAVALLGLLAAIAVLGAAITFSPGVKKLGFNLPGRIASIGGFFKSEADARLYLWHSAKGMIAKRPLAGYGLGSFEREYHPFQLALRGNPKYPPDVIRHSKHAYNDYLEIASETGVIGLALWVALIGALLWRGLRGALREGPWGIAIVAAAFAFFVCGAFFQYPVFNAAGAALAFLWLGALHEPKLLVPAGAPAELPISKTAPRLVAAVLPVAVLLWAAAVWAPKQAIGYAYFNRAQDLISQNKYPAALEASKKAVAKQPAMPFFHYQKAQIHFALAAKDPEENFKHAARELRLTNRLFPYSRESHMLLGQIYLAQREFTRALAEFRAAEKYEYGDRTEIRLQVAAALLSAQSYDEALDVLAPEISKLEKKFRPLNKFAHAELVQHVGSSGLDWEALDPRQKALAEQFIAARGSLAHAYSLQAKAYLWKVEPKRSLAPMRRALTLDPNNSDFLYWYGTALALTNEYRSAAAAWQRAIQVNPNNAAARKALTRIMSIIQEEQPIPVMGAPRPAAPQSPPMPGMPMQH